MSQFTPEQEEMLLVWSEYGERPFDGIIEMGKVPEFLRMLYSFEITAPFYRGTSRHYNLIVGDILDYTYPTAWSHDEYSARNFIDGIIPSTLLIIPEGNFSGVENTVSLYSNEIEAILAPVKLIVTERHEIDGTIILLTKKFEV